MTLHRATSELVALAWLKGVAGIAPASVGTVLPEDNSTWAASGYVQLVTIVGGSPDIYVPRRQAVAQVDVWAVATDTGTPAWGKARELAELIFADCYRTADGTDGHREVSALMPSGFRGAYVQAAYPTTEPRRIPGDPGSYAHLTFDLSLTWVELASVESGG